MNLTYRGLASTLLLVAYGISAAFQLYRSSLDTGLEVDRFTPSAALAYLAFFGLAMALRLDRTWIWWLTGVVLTSNLVFGVVGYFPTVHAARPMDLFDWAEGTVFIGLLTVALGCTVLRLTGSTIARMPAGKDRQIGNLAAHRPAVLP